MRSVIFPSNLTIIYIQRLFIVIAVEIASAQFLWKPLRAPELTLQ